MVIIFIYIVAASLHKLRMLQVQQGLSNFRITILDDWKNNMIMKLAEWIVDRTEMKACIIFLSDIIDEQRFNYRKLRAALSFSEATVTKKDVATDTKKDEGLATESNSVTSTSATTTSAHTDEGTTTTNTRTKEDFGIETKTDEMFYVVSLSTHTDEDTTMTSIPNGPETVSATAVAIEERASVGATTASDTSAADGLRGNATATTPDTIEDRDDDRDDADGLRSDITVSTSTTIIDARDDIRDSNVEDRSEDSREENNMSVKKRKWNAPLFNFCNRTKKRFKNLGKKAKKFHPYSSQPGNGEEESHLPVGSTLL